MSKLLTTLIAAAFAATTFGAAAQTPMAKDAPKAAPAAPAKADAPKATPATPATKAAPATPAKAGTPKADKPKAEILDLFFAQDIGGD